MMQRGFVTLNRIITTWRWYKEPLTALLYYHLIVTANWCSDYFKGIEIKRGERVISYATLADETGMSVQNVRTAISHMISTNEVTKRQHGKYTIISITDYDELQLTNKTSNKNSDNISNKELTTNKEYKNIKEDKKEEERMSSSISKVVQKYVEICKPLCQPNLTPELAANIRKALNFYGIDDLTAVFETVTGTPFLNGQVSEWQADLAWIFTEGNIDKILSGKYKEYNRKPVKKEYDPELEKYKCLINNFPDPPPLPFDYL